MIGYLAVATSSGADNTALITAIGAIVVATLGGVYGLLGKRKEASSSELGTLTTGQQQFIDRLQKDVDVAYERLEDCRKENDTMRSTISTLRTELDFSRTEKARPLTATENRAHTARNRQSRSTRPNTDEGE